MMSTYRTERDLIGEKQVPKDAYYGIQTMRARENFPITGYPPHPELIRAFGYVKKAAAMANRDVGVLQTNIADAIMTAADEIIEGKLQDQFIVDAIQGGAGTSFNMNANEVIANRAIEILGGEKGEYMRVSPNTHVNMAQSTNDAFPTAIHIASLRLADGLTTELKELITALKAKEEEFDNVLKMGRTHLQDAVASKTSLDVIAPASSKIACSLLAGVFANPSVAIRAIPVAEAIVSRQPVFPQLQGAPPSAMEVMCPISPAIPFTPWRI